MSAELAFVTFLLSPFLSRFQTDTAAADNVLTQSATASCLNVYLLLLLLLLWLHPLTARDDLSIR